MSALNISCSLSNSFDHDLKAFASAVKADTSGRGRAVSQVSLCTFPVFSVSHRKPPLGFLRTLFSPAHNADRARRMADHISALFCLHVRALGGVYERCTDVQCCTEGNRRYISRGGFNSLRLHLSWLVVKASPQRSFGGRIWVIFMSLCVSAWEGQGVRALLHACNM